MLTYTEENYLKTIYQQSVKSKLAVVTTNTLADCLITTAASVSDMLRKLALKKLVKYKKYQGVQLSAKGEKIALVVLRKHRLWEMFLVEKLNFTWDEVHEVAEQLEHINSEKLITELDKFLRYPKFDPHGDPIPDAAGKIPALSAIKLSDALPNKAFVVIGVSEHSSAFLKHLKSMDIAPGTTLKVKTINPFDYSMQVLLNNRNTCFVSYETAKNILVQPLKKMLK